MGFLSIQALALFFVLAPGCIFFLSFHYSSGTIRLDMQRGVLMDTALFVLAAALLHGLIGYLLLYIAEAFTSCRVVESLGAFAGSSLAAIPSQKRCSIHLAINLGLLEFIIVGFLAALMGSKAAKLTLSKKFAKSVYGPYYDHIGQDAIVFVNVMTKIQHEGQVLMYEGKLDEISLNPARNINYICLIDPHRFLMKIGGKHVSASTTHRSLFFKIDRDDKPASRMTIPGEQISNVLMRSYPVIQLPDETTNGDEAHPRRSVFRVLWQKSRAIFCAEPS